MRRVAVVGASGSGKSTLARDLGHCLGVPDIDLDTLFHRPDWEPTPTPEFRRRVAGALDDADRAADGWVVAGNYAMVADIVHGRADTVVWLDLPRWRSTSRVVRRSLSRVVRREALWNGNRERWRNLLSPDPERNIVLWSWTSHRGVRRQYEMMATTPLWRAKQVHRLRSGRDVRGFAAEAQAASSHSASSGDG